MKLSVPFIPDPWFVHFLKDRVSEISSLYFPLYSGPIMDARIRLEQIDPESLCRSLVVFPDTRKYLLLNTRFLRPEYYHDSSFLDRMADLFEQMVVRAGLSGIVFTDAYFLNALAGTGRDILTRLEALPGVNCMMDSARKVFAFLDLIRSTGFRMPGKLVLDRSLNRDFKSLKSTVQTIQKNFPDVRIELLANEGCIDLCPFKPTHDAQIALANQGLVREMNFRTNQMLGCHAYFLKHPERFLCSPFIRPEDSDAYQGTADSLKLCGRSLGPRFMARCITAYETASFDGNLLDIMDAPHGLRDRIHIDNKRLDPGFLDMITSCPMDCGGCKNCRALFSAASTRKPFTLRQYKDWI